MTPSFTSISKGEKEVMQCNEVAKGTQKNQFKSECRPEIRKKNQLRQSKQKCGSLNDNCWACSRCHAYEWCDALRDRGNYISVTQTVPPRHTGPSLDTAVAGVRTNRLLVTWLHASTESNSVGITSCDGWSGTIDNHSCSAGVTYLYIGVLYLVFSLRLSYIYAYLHAIPSI